MIIVILILICSFFAGVIGMLVWQKRRDSDLLDTAWGIIANAHGGDWSRGPEDWHAAAIRWRDRYHETL